MEGEMYGSHSQPPSDADDTSGGSGLRCISLGGGGQSQSWEWVVDIEKEVKSLNAEDEEEQWSRPSIYRLPYFAKQLNIKAFTPQVVSLGPFHYGSKHLWPLEVHKRRALVHLLGRCGRPLDDFVRAVKGSLKKLQDSYDSLSDEWRRDEDGFVRLMIVDGCFILEVLRLELNEHGTVDSYAPNDPFFSRHGLIRKIPYVRRDMLLLENQLPLLALKLLHDVEKCGGKCMEEGEDGLDYTDINDLVVKFCSGINQKAPKGLRGVHVLDLYRQTLIMPGPGPRPRPHPRPHQINISQAPRAPQKKNKSKAKEREGVGEGEHIPIVRSAVELSEAGVTFRRSDSSSLRDISFRRGVLTLPRIVMDDATEYIYLNLVALEHLYVQTGNEITSYVAFMEEIIDSAKDVNLLQTRGIMENVMGSDKDVARLFNTIGKEVTLDPDSEVGSVRQAMNKYCHKKWHRWRANLMHTYFRNPWSLFSVAAAALVILLTLCQTTYSIISYHLPNN